MRPFELPSVGNGRSKSYLPYVPDYKYIDSHKAWERVSGGRHVGTAPKEQLQQVEAFLLLGELHDYIRDAGRELAAAIGTPLCQEQCCCLHRTPFISRLEAEYIISRSGYYSQLVALAEQWLLTPHEEAPTYPGDQPQILGGTPTPLALLPQIGQELRALAGMRSPFVLAEADSGRERIVSGRFVQTSMAGGTALVHRENRDLLAGPPETQPLICAVSGVFRLPPAHCTRRLGLGETAQVRLVADPRTVQRYYQELLAMYRRLPDKAVSGLLPTMIMLAARPLQFRRHVDAGRVALAKLALGDAGLLPIQLWEPAPIGRAEQPIVSSAFAGTGGTRRRETPLVWHLGPQKRWGAGRWSV